jgi:hypothetical protein
VEESAVVSQEGTYELTNDTVVMVESGYVDWDGLDGAPVREIVRFDWCAG